jgi:hypothetical protein
MIFEFFGYKMAMLTQYMCRHYVIQKNYPNIGLCKRSKFFRRKGSRWRKIVILT